MEMALWPCMHNLSWGDAVQSHCSLPQAVSWPQVLAVWCWTKLCVSLLKCLYVSISWGILPKKPWSLLQKVDNSAFSKGLYIYLSSWNCHLLKKCMHRQSRNVAHLYFLAPPALSQSLLNTVKSVDFGVGVEKTHWMAIKNLRAIHFCEVSKHSGTVTEYTSRLLNRSGC